MDTCQHMLGSNNQWTTYPTFIHPTAWCNNTSYQITMCCINLSMYIESCIIDPMDWCTSHDPCMERLTKCIQTIQRRQDLHTGVYPGHTLPRERSTEMLIADTCNNLKGEGQQILGHVLDKDQPRTQPQRRGHSQPISTIRPYPPKDWQQCTQSQQDRLTIWHPWYPSMTMTMLPS